MQFWTTAYYYTRIVTPLRSRPPLHQTAGVAPLYSRCSSASPWGSVAGSGTCCPRWWSWVSRRRPGSPQTWPSASCWSCPGWGTPGRHAARRCSSLWTGPERGKTNYYSEYRGIINFCWFTLNSINFQVPHNIPPHEQTSISDICTYLFHYRLIIKS